MCSAGRHSSVPQYSQNPRPSTEKKASTFPGGQSLTQVTDVTLNHEHQETSCGDSDKLLMNTSSTLQPQNSTSTRSTTTLPFSAVEESSSYSVSVTHSEQAPLSHDQMHQSRDPSHDPPLDTFTYQPVVLSSRRGMSKQISCDEQLFAVHAAVRTTPGMYRSSSSAATCAPVGLQLGDRHSVGSSMHSNISDLPPAHPVSGQLAWRFSSNPSSSNVSQENILASSHSDVNVPTTSNPRVLVQPHSHHHPPTHGNNTLSQQGIPHNHHCCHHAVNQQGQSFSVGGSCEASLHANSNHSCHSTMPHAAAAASASLSQCSCCQCGAAVLPHSVCQRCSCQQHPDASNCFQHTDQPVAGFHSHLYGGGCNGSTDSRCASRASSVRPPAQFQHFPSAYLSSQNSFHQQLIPLSFAPPRQSQTRTRHLSLISQHDRGHVPHHFSGYGTDGSGDEVFHPSSEDHSRTAPERSSTHPQVANGASKMIQSRRRVSQDPLHDSTTVHTRRIPGHSGTRMNRVPMETPFVGPAISEENNSKNTWDIASHASDFNDSGFFGSTPHGTSGESVKYSTEHKRPPPQPTMSNYLDKSPPCKPKKQPPSISCEQDDAQEDLEDDDSVPVVYKNESDDETVGRFSSSTRYKERVPMRGAVQYRSLRHQSDKQIQQRKTNRNSVQSFDRHTLDSLERRSKSKRISKSSSGAVNGSVYSLKSKSSQDMLSTSLTVPKRQVCNPTPVSSRHHPNNEEGKLRELVFNFAVS